MVASRAVGVAVALAVGLGGGFAWGYVTAAAVAPDGERQPEPAPPAEASTSAADPAAPPLPRQRPGPAAGHWQRVSAAASGTEDVEATRDLANVPYLSGYVEGAEGAGVALHDRERAQPGYNLIVSGHAAEALLCDMDGVELHRWRFDVRGFDPRRARRKASERAKSFWRRAHVFPNGDLLAIFDGYRLIRLDRESGLVWAVDGGCHHDVCVDDQGDIHALGRRVRRRARARAGFAQEGPIWEDEILTLNSAGKVLRRVSVLECFLRSDYSAVLHRAARDGDVLHTNTIEVLDGRFADVFPAGAKGNVLISSPTTDTIAILDPRQRTVVWAMSGMWKYQHEPSLVDGGRVLLFDNQGHHGKSKVIEFDPRTQQIVWSYRGADDAPLFSVVLGACHRLANGNTLITESTAGRALEVTAGGEVVWEYLNPQRIGKQNELVATLFDTVRLEPDYFAADFVAAWQR
ncbi:MAG: arylsulfotransferase family protein [Planctomycetota bacterium]